MEAILGPFGFGFITNTGLLTDISKIGIIFLLFLLGLDMQPKNMMLMLRKATFVALLSSGIFAATGYLLAQAFGFTQAESFVIGIAMMFSSTIIGIKLLPTTVLHHRYTGELVVGLLLLQDLIAIFVLLVLYTNETGEASVSQYLWAVVSLPVLVGVAVVFVKYVLLSLIQRFDRFQEYIFLIAIGWCLGLAELAEFMGLSSEIGAFIAGIALATSPIAQFIAISLKPLRDFFLILFFFSIGAGFNLGLVSEIVVPAVLLAILVLVIKPVTFRVLLAKISDSNKLAWEVGFRLGQISEFSLLIAYIATSIALIGERASVLIQATAILTFLASSYLVVFRYPTPIAVSDELRRD
ncbi:Glutathione-regulated potassium-efflux system protein KefB [gamma proteobacterium IMCC2047]|nr:Glutathione-regulated potassium-efflux system protein KefB [gamma proteobacterium IMCC2047]